LGSSFDGFSFDVTVAVDKDGFVSCGYDELGNLRLKRRLRVSDTLLRNLAETVCSSVRTWKFRPLVIERRSYAFFGPVVVNIERQKFTLSDPDPLWQYNPAPVKRQSDTVLK